MERRRRPPSYMNAFEDLARKSEILERELAVQRRALERLKEMSASPKAGDEPRIAEVRRPA